MEVIMRPMQACAMVLVMAMGGCGLFNSSGGGPVIADARSPITDVPVPAGFSMSEESTSRQMSASNLRIVNHRYTGHEDFMEVVDFYKRVLPTKGWVRVDQSQQPGNEVSMQYVKKGEACNVTVWERTFDTVIRVKIDPIANR
jgi:hypothetical protein